LLEPVAADIGQSFLQVIVQVFCHVAQIQAAIAHPAIDIYPCSGAHHPVVFTAVATDGLDL